MIYSMTGYGKSERAIKGTTISIEVRSLNNRFLDLIYRAPRMFVYKESEVRERVKKNIERGKLSLNLNIQSDDYAMAGLKIDPTLVKQYSAMLNELIRQSGIRDEIRLEHLLSFSEIFAPNAQDEQYDALWQEVLLCVDDAMTELNHMRQSEGAAITTDLLNRVKLCGDLVNQIETISVNTVQEELRKLQERVEKLINRAEIDPQRMNQEVAIIADKIDITEEIVRFRSHCQLFEKQIRGPETKVGRKLTFIIQEMGREVNTMGSKSPRSDVIHLVVSIKEELEKLREQLQNVE
jgi:uncharacterized protein (TIGR00255 family)